MANRFSVTRATVGEGERLVLLTLQGALDAYTAPSFEASVQAELDAGRVQLIVDCLPLAYISSAGLGVFMEFIDEIREKGGDLKLCGLLPKVRHVFELLGFHALFDILPDVPGAIAQFSVTPQKVV